MSVRVFVSGTGTGVGKTHLGCALVRHLRGLGREVVALKPLETGVDPRPEDAEALAEAAGRPALAHAVGLYRARAPLAPYAASLGGEPAPDLRDLARRVRVLEEPGADLLVEGAGGLFVPLDGSSDVADLVHALGLPVLLVAPDRLGVLSDVLAHAGLGASRGLRVAAVALNQPTVGEDASVATNARILAERLAVPVVRVPHGPAPREALEALRIALES